MDGPEEAVPPTTQQIRANYLTDAEGTAPLSAGWLGSGHRLSGLWHAGARTLVPARLCRGRCSDVCTQVFMSFALMSVNPVGAGPARYYGASTFIQPRCLARPGSRARHRELARARAAYGQESVNRSAPLGPLGRVQDRKPRLILSSPATRIVCLSGVRLPHVCVGQGFIRFSTSCSLSGDQFVSCSCKDQPS